MQMLNAPRFLCAPSKTDNRYSPNGSIPPFGCKIERNRHKQRCAQEARSPLVVVLRCPARADGAAPVQIENYCVAERHNGEEGEGSGCDEGYGSALSAAEVEEGYCD